MQYASETLWIRLEDILKTWAEQYNLIIRPESALKTSLQDVLKMSWRCLQNAYKVSSWRCLEDVLKTSWRCLEDVLKMTWRSFYNTSWRRLEEVLKTSWRRLENVLKTYDQNEYIGLDQDVFWRRISIANMFVLKTSSEDEDKRRFQDVFKTSSSRRMFAGLPVKLFD